MVLKAGDLRMRCELKRRTADETKDDANRTTYTWSTIFTPYAKVESLSGRELEQARTIIPNASYRVSIRQPEDQYMPTSEDRWYLSREAKTLEIEYVTLDAQRREVMTLCGETL